MSEAKETRRKVDEQGLNEPCGDMQRLNTMESLEYVTKECEEIMNT